MILYHGTNKAFDTIDLTKSKPNKDFGQGFYLSREYSQAMEMAKTKFDQIKSGFPTVLTVEKTMSEIDQMKLDMVTKLASLLMDEQPELTMEQALSIVLNSDTYQRLLEDNTTLYYQSPRYVFSFLQTELQTGKVG